MGLDTIRDLCVQKAIDLLKKNNRPTERTVNMVSKLTEAAISIDLLNLRKKEQSRFFGAASQGRLSQQRAKENSVEKDVE